MSKIVSDHPKKCDTQKKDEALVWILAELERSGKQAAGVVCLHNCACVWKAAVVAAGDVLGWTCCSFWRATEGLFPPEPAVVLTHSLSYSPHRLTPPSHFHSFTFTCTPLLAVILFEFLSTFFLIIFLLLVCLYSFIYLSTSLPIYTSICPYICISIYLYI